MNIAFAQRTPDSLIAPVINSEYYFSNPDTGSLSLMIRPAVLRSSTVLSIQGKGRNFTGPELNAANAISISCGLSYIYGPYDFAFFTSGLHADTVYVLNPGLGRDMKTLVFIPGISFETTLKNARVIGIRFFVQRGLNLSMEPVSENSTICCVERSFFSNKGNAAGITIYYNFGPALKPAEKRDLLNNPAKP
jgi:hypothetical protein